MKFKAGDKVIFPSSIEWGVYTILGPHRSYMDKDFAYEVKADVLNIHNVDHDWEYERFMELESIYNSPLYKALA